MKLRRPALFWLFLLVLMLGSPISAQDQTDPSAEEASDKGSNQADELAAANRRVRELESSEAVREAKAELADGAYSRLEIVVGIFGVLITVVVLNLALRTKDAAIAEARVVATNTAKDDAKAAIELVKAEFDVLLTQERNHVIEIEKKLDEVRATVSDIGKLKAKAQKHADSIQQDADKADELIERLARESIAGAKPELTDEDREVLETASEAAKDTAQNEWTIEQFRAAISKAQFVDKDLPRAAGLARDMVRLHGEDDDAFAFAMNLLGDFELKQDNHIAAIDAYGHVRRRLYDATEPNRRSEVYWALHHMGIASCEIGDVKRAEDWLKEAFDTAVAIHGEKGRNTLITKHELARARLDQGRAAEAEAAFEQLLPIWDQVDDPDASCTLASRHELARAILDQGRAAEAEALFSEVLPLMNKVEGPEASRTLITRHVMARAILAQGRAAEAEAAFFEILSLKEKVNGPTATGTLATRYYLALACQENGDPSRAQAILDAIPDTSDRNDWIPYYAACLAYVRGKVADALGLTEDARSHLAESRRLYEENFPDDYYPRCQLEAYIEQRGGIER